MSEVYNLQTYVRDRKLPYLILCILRGPCIFVLVILLLFRQLSQSIPSSYTLESILGVLLDHTCYDYFSYNFSSFLIRRLHDFIIPYLRLKARDFLSPIGTLKLVQEVRVLDNRKEKTTFTIIDAQSVKNTDTAKNKGYDAGKKVSGIKRHIVVDTNVLPHAMCVTTADVTDRNGAIEMIIKNHENLSQVQNILVDAGYSGENFANSVSEILGCTVEVVKRSEINAFKVIPKRWVVERSFAWLDKCRRLWKNCERYLHTSLQIMVLAFSVLFVKRL